MGDVRALPFLDASFDAIYSMGTIEHFDETERAIEEMARVLKPGGRAIVGVPNRHDPFLRPLLATVLQAVGLYGYGYEKSYSRRALRQMLEKAGLNVIAETAILFIPGWLRMLDLACHAWCRPIAAVTGALVRPFMFLDRHVPAVRRHGYLLATVVMKPEGRA
jgi:SAM-dependent methyltransferase